MRDVLGVLACVLAFASASGCPPEEDDSSEPDASSAEGRRNGAGDVCEAYAAYERRCASPDAGGERKPSWATTECPLTPWHYVRSEYVEATSACLATLPCDGSDDACTTLGLAAIGIEDEADFADDTLFARCGDRAEACGFLDDLCLAFLTFTDAGRTAAERCLDGPCDGAEACLRDL